MSVPIEFWRALSPQRGAPTLLLPQDRYFTRRVSFAPEDLAAAKRAMACHRTQFTSEVVERVSSASAAAWNSAIPLIPAFPATSATSLF
jgi:hypothetical protein